MAERKTAKRPATKTGGGFTADERAAMRERAKELKAEASKADSEGALLEKIAEMKGSDRTIAKRLHAIVTASAPDLVPKTWYGMPAYANKQGKVVCFFRDAAKFKERYAMLGFQDYANLDDGSMWPVAFAITKLTKADEAKIAALVKQAVS